MHKLTLPIIALAVLVGLPPCCTQNISGVETTNGYTVTATATSIEGVAPPSTHIFLFDTNYIPFIDSGIGIATAADFNGTYRIQAPVGKYNVIVITSLTDEGDFINETIATQVQSRGGAAQKIMRRLGAVSGKMGGALQGKFLVYLAGTGHYEVFSGQQDFHLTSVPAGMYTLRIAQLSESGNEVILNLVERSVTVDPGKTVNCGTMVP